MASVLIVEDDQNVLAVLRGLLTEFGYHTRGAYTGPDALRIIPSFKPDVVLVDLALIDMPGEHVLERLRTTAPAVPVIVVTGNQDPDRARRTLARGAFDYVAKPFNVRRLQQVLEAALLIPDPQQGKTAK
jgi:DNA-binding NtrC family response regulator